MSLAPKARKSVVDLLWTVEDVLVLNSVECGVNLFIYLFTTFSKRLLLDFRCWLFSIFLILFLFSMFMFMGQITRFTLCSGRINPSNIISIIV